MARLRCWSGGQSARVALGLRVLSYNDLSITHPGYYVFLTHHIVKETMAVTGSVGNIGAVLGGDVKLVSEDAMFDYTSRYAMSETAI